MGQDQDDAFLGKTLHVVLRGGFANQLFEWAHACAVRERTGCNVVFDTRLVNRPTDRGLEIAELLRREETIQQARTSKEVWKIVSRALPSRALPRLSAMIPVQRAIPAYTNFADIIAGLQLFPAVRQVGYAQDLGVVARIQNLLVERLNAAYGAHRVGRYAAIHVRRGDYVTNRHVSDRFGVPALQYYVEAATLFESRRILLVSDDPRWCGDVLAPALRDRLGMKSQVESSVSGGLHADFALLRSASELALSNSTFSWWAAFAGAAHLVYAPYPWFDDGSADDFPRPNWRLLDKKTGEASSLST